MKSAPDSHSLERIIPEELAKGETTGQDTLRLHLERYEYAARFACGKVLDAACGVGYGASLLAAAPTIREVVGVDIAPEAIAYAEAKYSHPKITYCCTDLYHIQPPAPFDAIVSLETLEHLPDPKRCLRHFYGLLQPGGLLIASVPITPSMDGNPHHLCDFNRQGFLRALGQAGFTVEDQYRQVQPYHPLILWSKKEKRTQTVRSNLLRWYLRYPAKFWLRISALLSHGFQNHYLVVKARK